MIELAQVISVSIDQNVIHLKLGHVLETQRLGNLGCNCGLKLVLTIGTFD